MSAIAPIESTALFASEASRAVGANTGAHEATSGMSQAFEGTGSVDSFGSILGTAVEQANHAELAASQKVEALASGAIDDLHGTMISVKEAEIGIKLVGTVRNKILDAFQELWRTSV